MVTPSVGSVVLVRFPFSDLSASKLRPAVVLAGVDRDDWILCQVTSNPYSDARAVEITDSDFASGSLSDANELRTPRQAFLGEHIAHGTDCGRPETSESDSGCLCRDCGPATLSGPVPVQGKRLPETSLQIPSVVTHALASTQSPDRAGQCLRA